MLRFASVAFAALLVVTASADAADLPGWEATIANAPAGNFPELRPLRATYRFGWNGIVAGSGEVQWSRIGTRAEINGTGSTTGVARNLWKFDAEYHSAVDAKTLRPIEARAKEQMRSKTMLTKLVFDNAGVARTRSEGSAAPTAPRRFDCPNLFDLQSALLYLRSQPLRDGAVQHVVVYPQTSAYYATVTVLGREKVSVAAGEYNAIKLDLRLDKIGKTRQLEPHKKFKRATIWVSDDADRLMVKAEAQIFVGAVFAELESIRFDIEKH